MLEQVCVCAPGGAGGPGACDYVAPNQQQASAGGVVVCSEGFHLQVRVCVLVVVVVVVGATCQSLHTEC